MGLIADLLAPFRWQDQATPAPPAPTAQRAAPTPADFVPVVYAERLLGTTDTSASPAQIRAALRGTVYVATRLRANAVAEGMLKAKVVRASASNPNDHADVEASHPWAVLLRRPCPALPPRMFWRWVQMNKDLGRGAFLYVERDTRGVPVALWPIYASFGEMRAVAGGRGEVERFVLHRADGRRVELPGEDVVWVRHPHPLSPTESASLLMAAAYESDVDLAEKIYRRDNVRGSGAARLQITTEQTLTAEQAMRMGAQAREKLFGGRDTVPVFGQGSKALPIGLSAQDMEFIEGSKLNTTGLLQIFGVPEGLFSDKANRANADAARYVFADLTVQPEVDDAADQLTADLVQAFRGGEGVLRVQAPEVVPLDPDFLLRQEESYLKTARRTINELRAADGREPYGPWADRPLVSAAMASAEDVAAPRLARTPQPGKEGETAPARGTRAARADDTDDEHSAAWTEIDRRRSAVAAPVQDAAEAVLGAMHRSVLARLLDTRAVRQDAPAGLTAAALFDVDDWIGLLAEELGGPLASALRAGFESGAMNASYDGAFDASSDAARSALARVVEKTSTVPETVRGMLETALRDGLGAGEDVSALSKRIGQLFDELRAWEAEAIAQTSASAAFEAGQQQAFEEAGITRHMWLSERDARVRTSHARCDGVTRTVGEAFPNGLRYPHDPDAPAAEVVRCRCTCIPVLE